MKQQYELTFHIDRFSLGMINCIKLQTISTLNILKRKEFGGFLADVFLASCLTCFWALIVTVTESTRATGLINAPTQDVKKLLLSCLICR